MPTQQNRTPRGTRPSTRATSPGTAGRFGRGTSAPSGTGSAGRFGRGKSASSGTSSAGRFGRGTPPARSTSRRSPSSKGQATRRGTAGGWLQRGKAKPTGIKRVTGALPGVGKSTSSSSSSAKRSGAAGGLALAAGAAGLAFKNRDKLTGRLKRRGEDSGTDASFNGAAPPTTPLVDPTATRTDTIDTDAPPRP